MLFPSRYLFTIGHMRLLAFDDGPPIFRQRSSVHRRTGLLSEGGPTRPSRCCVGHSSIRFLAFPPETNPSDPPLAKLASLPRKGKDLKTLTGLEAFAAHAGSLATTTALSFDFFRQVLRCFTSLG